MNPALGYVRTPTIAHDRIVFVCEDDLWIVGSDGGVAMRLTTAAATCALPRLSPDGTRIAYVGRDEGHPELYVMSAAGGPSVRLTFLGSDALYACGWSADGATIFFTSDAGSPFVKETLAFRVAADGGEPEAVPIGHAMSFDVDARGATVIGRNAIDPARWKRYRGGTAGQLWIDAGASGTYTRLCADVPGNLVWPMWCGERVVFLSDHEGIANLYSVAADGGDLRRLTDEREYFARYPATDGARVVYAAGGELVVCDAREGSVRRIPVEMPSSAPETVRRFVDAGDLLETFTPSHDGTRVGFVSRGRAFAMPLWEEAVTEYGPDDGARRRLVRWMPGDRDLVYVDDAAGWERIMRVPADGGTPVALTHDDLGIVHDLDVAPHGGRLAFTTNRMELHVLEADGGSRVVDRGVGERIADLQFSPDGAWLAYTWSPRQGVTIVRLYECASGRIADATQPLRRDRSPAWDPAGKYLYLLSERDFRPVYDALQFELSFPEATRPYLLTLAADTPNPFVPKPAPLHRRDDDDDDDEPDAEKDGEQRAPAPVRIDVDGLALRMLPFPVDEGDYDRVAAVKGRALFSRFAVRGIDPANRDRDGHHGGELRAYDFDAQRAATLAGGIDDFTTGRDGRTVLYVSEGRLRAIDGGGDLPDDDEPLEERAPHDASRKSGWLDLGRVSVLVEPPREWAQMLREAWRLQRENFWDPQMSGVDWDAVLRRYEALLPRVRSRDELSDLIWEMHGELGTSHAYESGGDRPVAPPYQRGFLGADLAWDAAHGGYRITRILRGDAWNRDADSPLAEPGLDVRDGDVITAIAGRPLSRAYGPGAALVNRAGTPVALTIVRDGGEARRVLVKTLKDERMLRYRAWVERNRADVHARTDGRAGYLHIPDMGPWGFAEFHRGYLGEFDRAGLIVDVRYNRGGHVSALLLEKLARRRVGYDVSRWLPPAPYPEESARGPLVALTNQFAGSDGDIFSHCFKLYELGPLVGMRTWGGVVGIHPRHRLVDGTETTQPEFSFWFTDAGWGVENYGTDPTHEVDIAPHDVAAGRDPQLETALRLIEEALAQAPPRPAFPPKPIRAHRP